MVGFVDAVKMWLNRFKDFQGRSTRSEYWWVILFNVLVMAIPLFLLMKSYGGNLEAMEAGVMPSGGMMPMAIIGIYALITLVPNIALAVRRFHDLNQTGWLYLAFIIVGLIPLVGMLASLGMLVWFCMRGTVGQNKYGDDPLGG